MGGKKDIAGIAPAGAGERAKPPGGAERDLVSFYSLLARTLEEACGRDPLAKRLADERGAGPAAGDRMPGGLQALGRCCRRIGLVADGIDIEDFSREFIRNVSAAVSRPEGRVSLLLGLFAAGEAGGVFEPICGSTPNCRRCLLTRECDYFNYPRKPEMAALPPAARLAAGNAEALSDQELMSVILFGHKATGREELIGILFARYGRLTAMARAEQRELAGARGMTEHQALRLSAINILHRRLQEEKRGEMLHISRARDLCDRYAPELAAMRGELAVLILLDSQNHIIRDTRFGQDSPNITHVKIGDLLRPAIVERANGVALVHNHPGNNPTPSQGDIDYTLKLRLACETIGLKLLDHVIVGDSGYYSFSENGMSGV